MKNRLPVFSDKLKICVICEGNEEYAYLKHLNSLKVWNAQYELVLDNACGNGNIPARYQDRYQNGSYELVLIFCDTERKPYEQYEDIKRKINDFHGMEHAADEVVIFGNPCTMQIIVKHLADEILSSPAKSANAPFIQKYAKVAHYKGRADQIQELMKSITADNYKIMKQRIAKVSMNDREIGSSNFSKLLSCLESSNNSWINDINDKLENP